MRVLFFAADELSLGALLGMGMSGIIRYGAEHCILIARLIVEMLFDAAMGFI
jgi:hypothetical protein